LMECRIGVNRRRRQEFGLEPILCNQLEMEQVCALSAEGALQPESNDQLIRRHYCLGILVLAISGRLIINCFHCSHCHILQKSSLLHWLEYR
jgi:hypothetical protein